MPDNLILAFGGTDTATWTDPLFRKLPSGHAVLLSFGVLEYGAPLVDKLRNVGMMRLDRVDREAISVDAKSNDEFNEASTVLSLLKAGFVYLQGGNPRFMVQTLSGTRFWNEVLARKLPIVATSGSAMALGERCPELAPGKKGWVDGLGVVENSVIAPHWDSFHAKDPSFRSIVEKEAGERKIYTLDDMSALEINGENFSHGLGMVQIREKGIWRSIPPAPQFDI